MLHTSLIIGGQDVDAAGGTFERKNPFSGEVATQAAAATPDDARKAVEAAQAAFKEWSGLAPAARRAHLQAAAAELRAQTGEFIKRMMAETGCTEGWGHFNVGFAASLLDEAAAITTQVNGEVVPSNHPSTLSFAVRQPAGVVLGIAPWNAPVILGVRALAVPLACGNTVILKASEVCPATHALIAEVFRSAGLPDGVVNLVTHPAETAAEVVEAMISHPAVRRVNFTGSTRVGRIIGEMSGRYLKPVVLELGGKAPLVVLDDADVDEAVKAAAFGAFMHQGQICMSTERLIVDEKIADEFVEKLKTKVISMTVGNPNEGNFMLGGVVDMSTVDRVKDLIKDAVDKGATLVTGGSAEGVVMDPAIVDHVKPDMKIYSDESFGPVVSIIRVKGDEDALTTANDSEYGLSASVFSRDISRAISIAQRIDSGICHINSPTVQDEAQVPFGGTKSSGVGRFGGAAGIHEFTVLRWMSIETGTRHYPI